MNEWMNALLFGFFFLFVRSFVLSGSSFFCLWFFLYVCQSLSLSLLVWIFNCLICLSTKKVDFIFYFFFFYLFLFLIRSLRIYINGLRVVVVVVVVLFAQGQCGVYVRRRATAVSLSVYLLRFPYVFSSFSRPRLLDCSSCLL